MNPISSNLDQGQSNWVACIGLRIFAVAASIAACASLAGCAPDTHTAGDPPSWATVGNNGGKVDRYSIARAAQLDASPQVASAPAATGKMQ